MNIADVLSGRATSEGIQRLLLSAPTQEVLADQLRAMLPPGAAVGPFRLTEVRFKPGRKIIAYYDTFVDTESPKGNYIRPIAVTWAPNASEDEPPETTVLAKIEAEAVRRGVAAPFQQLWKDFRDWSMRVWVSPLDARFNQLVRLSDPQHLHVLLAKTGLAESDQCRSRDYRVTPIKYRPGKGHVLRYDPLDAGAETVFAKLYIAEDRARVFRREDAARCFRVASTAAEWLEEQGGPAHCLRPPRALRFFLPMTGATWHRKPRRTWQKSKPINLRLLGERTAARWNCSFNPASAPSVPTSLGQF